MSELQDTVQAAIAAVLDPGVDVETVEIQNAGRRNIVRVVIDTDGGIDLDHVAAASQAISGALDAPNIDALLGEKYVLEVTSPGVDRPLTTSTHWRRAVGRLVRTPAAADVEVARIISVQDQDVTLDVAGTQITVGVTQASPGHIEVEFNRSTSSTGEDTDSEQE